MINWNYTYSEGELAARIAWRAHAMDPLYSIRDAEMDVLATHLNGCPLRLADLLAAPDVDFAHDVFGIRHHLNRDTGKLMHCFDPRCSVPQTEAA